jgi:hypothetical protein
MERALVFMAWVVETFGPQYVCLFEAIEERLQRARTEQSACERAKHVLAEQSDKLPWNH